MAVFKIFAFCAVIAFAKGCNMNAEEFQTIGMQCAGKHPELLLEMTANMNMQNPDSDKVFDIFCKHKPDVVDILLCVIDKMEDCLPQFKPVMKLIGSQDRWLSAMNLICDNKKTLQDECMQENMQPFMACYMGHVTSMAQSGLVRDPKDIVCRVIHSEENCLIDNRGSCSDKYMKVLKDMLETIFPVEDCTKNAVGKDHINLANSLLGSILVHGQPQGLKFKPNNNPFDKPYVIKN